MKETMREMFKGYVDYQEQEYKFIWENALFVFDTNILLNFYRYSEETRKTMFEILETLKKRLWIPYQVAFEFYKNRVNVIINAQKKYKELATLMETSFIDIQNKINQIKSNQLKCKKDIEELLEKENKKLQDLLEKERKEKEVILDKDTIEEKIVQFLNINIGKPFEEEEYQIIKEEGLRRRKEKIPPGYEDTDKEENGDYYIFYSMIQESIKKNKPIIFVTDDVKEDWMTKTNGISRGRSELLNEFYKKTHNLLLIYTSDGFVNAYNKNFNPKKTDAKLIDELRNVRKTESINTTISSSSYENPFLLDFGIKHLMETSSTLDANVKLKVIEGMVLNNPLNKFQKMKLKTELDKLVETIPLADLKEETKDRINALYPKLVTFGFHEQLHKRRYDKLVEDIEAFCMETISKLKICRTEERQQRIMNSILRELEIYIELCENRMNSPYQLLTQNIKELRNILMNNKQEKEFVIKKIKEFCQKEIMAV